MINILPNNYDSFIVLMVILSSSFFGAFAKELNDSAKNNESFLLFLSEILINGISGSVIGIGVSKFICNDLLITLACSAVGGILGLSFLKYSLRVVILLFSKIKEIDLGNIDQIHNDMKDKD